MLFLQLLFVHFLTEEEALVANLQSLDYIA
jgi:hypothetical protein